ncbi:MAG TPA: CAP domain-containing protein [Minicystis sp.]|nr:CAP domain-containing protein [Minicystis sp.]
MQVSLRFALGVAVVGGGAVACNALTGVGDLHVTGDGAGGAVASGGAGQGPGSGTANGGAANGPGTGPSSGGAGPTGPSGSSSATTASGPTTSSSSGGPTCSPACGPNAFCEAQTSSCVCDPGFSMQGGQCIAVAPGDPSTHTQADVCTHWTEGHAITTPSPLTASGQQCDPGTLKQGAITDTLTRIDMFRWLVGLGPVVDDANIDQNEQACANLEAWWDFSSPDSPHAPPPTATCYTAAGGMAAGQSNIAWGSGHPANSIDQYIQDTGSGNRPLLGHRRWVLNPPLDPIGIGYWETGGTYGNASCLYVFGGSGSGPNPPWNSIPPAGFTPIELTQYAWSFEGSLGGIPGATVTVLRVDDDTQLPVTMQALAQGYGQDATSWYPNGWTAEVGKTYRVTVSGVSGGPIVYDVKPVACN